MPPLRLLGLRALRSADGEPPCPADSVRLFTPAVHLPVRPWSPRSRGFPRCRCRPHGCPAPSRRYERRRPEKTPLHKIVSENLESWLAWREAVERSVPAYVEDELRGYLQCGLLCFGFARAVCMTCRTGFVVAARLSRAWQPWEPLAFPSAARQDGAMDGPPCLWQAARAAASARPATAATWPRQPPTSPITSSRRCPCGSG